MTIQKELQKLRKLGQTDPKLLKIANNIESLLTKKLYSNKEAAYQLGVSKLDMLSRLRQAGVLQQRNIPYRKFLDNGYFVKQQRVHVSTTRKNVIVSYAVTPKGLEFINSIMKDVSLYTIKSVVQAYGIKSSDKEKLKYVYNLAYDMAEHRHLVYRAGRLNRMLLTNAGKNYLCKSIQNKWGFPMLRIIKPIEADNE